MGYIASLYNSGVGALQVGIRAGLPVGNPFYWSMSSLVLKVIYNLKMNCENPLRILFTPYPTRCPLSVLSLFVLIVVSKSRFSGLGSYRPVLSRVFYSSLLPPRCRGVTRGCLVLLIFLLVPF